MRLLFYAINGVGLGHVRRLLLIAEEVRRQRPEAHILFLTNTVFPQMIEERGFPAVRIPNAFSPGAQSHFPTRTLPADLHDLLFLSVLEHFAPDIMVFDGVWSEELLEAARRSRVRTALILRKGTNEHLSSILPALRRFDLICITHTEEEFRGLGATETLVSGFRGLGAFFAGAVMPRQVPRSSSLEVGSPFRILVTAGGGGWTTTGPFIEAAHRALIALLGRHQDVTAEVITGPLFKGDVERTRGQHPRITVHTYLEHERVHALMAVSALGIAQAGYNTCNDLLSAGLPSILVPAEREIESQAERVRHLEQAGWARSSACDAEGILSAAEQLYSDRAALGRMRQAAAAALTAGGTAAIAERILALTPGVERLNLDAPQELQPGTDFLVASGQPGDAALRLLAEARQRVRFLLLDADRRWLSSKEGVEALRPCVDGVSIPLDEEQARTLSSGAVPEELARVMGWLRDSLQYFEVRIPLGSGLLSSMAAVVETLHAGGCPQVQFTIPEDISMDRLERPLSEVRKLELMVSSWATRFYCSEAPILPSEFSRERVMRYFLAGRIRLQRERKPLESDPAVWSWLAEFGPRDPADQTRGRIDDRIRAVKFRHRLLAAPAGAAQPGDAAEAERIWGEWEALVRTVAELERDMARVKSQHLAGVTAELAEAVQKQEAFQAGSPSVETWRSLERRRSQLTIRYNRLWDEHLASLDSRYQGVAAREAALAPRLYALLVSERARRYRELAQAGAVRQYRSITWQLEQLDWRIVSLNDEIEASIVGRTSSAQSQAPSAAPSKTI